MEHTGRSEPGRRDAGDPAAEFIWNHPSFAFVSGPGVSNPIMFPTTSHAAVARPLDGSPVSRSHNHNHHNRAAGDAVATGSWISEPAIPQNAAFLGLPSQGQWIGPPSTVAPGPATSVGWVSTSAIASPIAASYAPVFEPAQHSVEGQFIFPFGQPFDPSVALDVPLISWSDGDFRTTLPPDVAASSAPLTDDSPSPVSTLPNSRRPSASPSISFVNDFGPPRQTSVQVDQPRKRKPEPPLPTLEIIQFRPDGSIGEDRSRKRRARDSEGSNGISPRTLKKVTYEDENGEMHGTMMTFGNPEHHRSRFTPEKRLETKLARREGVCSRCQGSKRKCDLALKESLYVPCTRCSTSKLYKNVSPMPCFKSVLKEVIFFRDGPAANEPFFTERFKRLAIEDISKPNVPVRNLQLTQRFGHKLMIYASEFVPLPGDKVSLTWKDARGNKHEMRMPPFCLTNMQKVTAQVCQYIYVAKQSYLEAAMRSSDKLVANTIRMATEYTKIKSGSLTSMALDLWAISRMIEFEWEMCGPDTLGVSRITEEGNPRKGKIPIPPMMDTQLDQIIIKEILYPLKKKLLDEFETRISPLKTEDWFDIYLTSFIVLNHIERLAYHSAYHARLHSMPTKFSNVGFLTNVFHTAKVILSRFHFVCNGSAPLSIDWDSPSALSMAKLDSKQITFMKETQALIKSRENDIVSLRTSYNYGTPLYWSSQLFTREWDDSPARVIEDSAS